MAAKLANMDGVRVSTYPGLNKRELWGPGPWEDEPDQVEWSVGAYECRVYRNHDGFLCGYVGLPSGHPWWGLSHDAVPAHVHGGLTFAARPIAGNRLPAERYWLGFDCGHGGIDYVPTSPGPPFAANRANYRRVEWVMSQVEMLVQQCALASAN